MEPSKLSLYGQYIQEREGKHIQECEHGFATYVYMNAINAVYVEDIYVVPEQRRSRVAWEMLDSICATAIDKGCHTLLGTVRPLANGSTESLKAILAYGFKVDSCDGGLIWFKKEI